MRYNFKVNAYTTGDDFSNLLFLHQLKIQCTTESMIFVCMELLLIYPIILSSAHFVSMQLVLDQLEVFFFKA